MQGFRIIAGCLVLAVGGLWTWTQWEAYHYAYAPLLGTPWGHVRAFYQQHSLYAPWAGLVWRWRWGSPSLRLGIIGGGLALLCVSIALGWLAWRLRQTQPPPMTGHGTTQWARRQDVRKAGLL